MQPNNLTALDFEDIKSSIKSYLRTRNEFTDYDFEGSSLSYLIDLLAYNTYYTSFAANMAMNEVFLPSATIRDNIVNIAKLLNYTPRSSTAASAFLHITVRTRQSAGSYPNNVTLLKGATATGGNYTWNRLDPYTVTVNQTNGIAELRCAQIFEGTIVTDSFTVDTFSNQKYVINSSDIDISSLKVTVRANESSTNFDVYNRVDNITTVKSTDRIYFLSETEDMRYEITFGDGIIGRKLGNGEIIDIEYLVSSGQEANGVKDFSFIGELEDNLGQRYNINDVTVVVADESSRGDAEESIESIKFNAPRWYSSQYRAVTALDYEVIVKKLYPNAKTVIAYGGDEVVPPVYGKVFIGIKTKTGAKINAATKNSLVQQLKPYAMASITPVIRDVDSIYINPKIFITYDSNCSNRSVNNIITNAQNAITNWSSQSGLNNFNGSFSLTKLQQAIVESDRCISDISTQISLLKYLNPTPGQTNTYCISTGAPIFDSAPSTTDPNQDATSCPKEPVVKSGKFRTKDRPSVDQYFEDDGYGNLRTYYTFGNRKVITNTKAGTIDYDSGTICLGPINIIGASDTNLPTTDGLDINTLNNFDGVEIDTSPETIASLGDLNISVLVIPANNSVILTPDPSTTLEVISPTISVSPAGTLLPSNIPLNSLNPSDFETLPTIIDIPDITNPGNLSANACF